MTKEREIELILKSKENIEYFREVYEFYLPKIFGYCINRLPNRNIAEDITSKVFHDAVKQIDNYHPRDGIRFGAWLYRIAHNKIVDHIRKESKRNHTELNELIGSEEPNHEREVVVSEAQIRVANVMAKLAPRYQQVLSLRFYSELDISEIAEVMKLKENNVSVLLHRASKAFKQQFEKEYSESEISELL
ncbi:MAG: sigma-70 family RNA polymerase sigma factor [Candidatus Dojkabacteria bacterium]|nr:MAG: sigma-70 family RNA polymerase sigma factor [Candidatus Dojkabacteria bacterium]